MKVLHINAVYGVGSTGVIVEDIHKLCLENKIDSYVAYSSTRKSADDIFHGYVIGKKLDKKLHAFLCRINGKQAYFSRGATKKLIKHIENIKPDIVHMHNLHSNYINVNMLLDYLGKNGISTVISLHDCWFFTGGCFHFTNAKCDGWLKGCGNCPKKKKDTPAYLFDMSAKILSDRKKYFGKIEDLTVVGVSQWIAGEADKTFFKGKTMTIHNGIDTDFFVNTPSDIRTELGIEDKFVVLGMANKWLDPVNKNALDYFSENLPSDSVMVLVGCNEEQKAALPKNVIGHGYVYDRNRLRQLYSMADVFVNCTREDSLPTVNIEPQSCGTPVVTYDNTGAKETVDNISGFYVETGNYKGLFERMMEIKQRESTAECREFVTNEFNRDKNYAQFIDLYKSIYEKKGRKGGDKIDE
ncbi:MAG: glycosyltransferase [Ruminococcaceae bacterium]|nr:glycosyltransferase [Oscillospiraceae bacterium]